MGFQLPFPQLVIAGFQPSIVLIILQVDLLQVDVQVSFRSMHFGWKRDGVTLWNKLGFTEFHVHGKFINFHHFPLQTGIHRHGIFGKRVPSGKVETGWNVVVKLYTSHSLGRWILYSPCIPSQVRAGTMSDSAVHLSSSASSASSVSLLQVKWDNAEVLVMKSLNRNTGQ